MVMRCTVALPLLHYQMVSARWGRRASEKMRRHLFGAVLKATEQECKRQILLPMILLWLLAIAPLLICRIANG